VNGLAGLIVLCVAVSGCASPMVVGCAPGERSAQIAKLFFGRNIGPAPGVSEADWNAFVEREIVPRFPEGLSVIDTAGVWRGADGATVHELGKAVVLVLSGRPDEAQRLGAVTAAYKTRFSQESVLTAKTRACVAA